MSRTLLLVRHGQTAWNVERRAQGHTDIPLDPTGLAQAMALAPALAAIRPAFVRSSDLARAAATAEVVAAACEVTVSLDARLREFDVGQRAGLTLAEFAATLPGEHARWVAEGGSFENADSVPGAESSPQVLARVLPALREAFAALAPGETGVVVGHGAALRMALPALLDLPSAVASGLLPLDNCAWAAVDDSAPDGRLRLASYNTVAPDFTTAGAVG